MEIIQQGAEAVIFKAGDKIIKNRLKKSYRLQIIDEKLRKQRTRKESKILEKASKLIPVPQIYTTNGKEKIEMQFIDGKKLSQFLDVMSNKNKIAKEIGKNIAKLHDNNIIHGDLTTSNMIYSVKEKKLYFIDFGLSFESSKSEDKAVDLHLIKEALEAKHFSYYENLWKSILSGYSISKNSKEVLKRLEKVEKRGRYKAQY